MLSGTDYILGLRRSPASSFRFGLPSSGLARLRCRIAIGCALAYVTILLCGVFFPEATHAFADALVHGDADARGVVPFTPFSPMTDGPGS